MRPLPPLAIRFGAWLAGSLACLVVGLSLLGTRPDLSRVVHEPTFLVHLGALLALVVASAASALNLSVPGSSKRWLDALPVLLLAATAALLTAELIANSSPAGPGIRCIRNLFLLSLLPGAALFRMLRQASPLRPKFAALTATLAVTTLSTLATRIVCANDAPLHLLLWHFLPLVGITAMVALGFPTRRIDQKRQTSPLRGRGR